MLDGQGLDFVNILLVPLRQAAKVLEIISNGIGTQVFSAPLTSERVWKQCAELWNRIGILPPPPRMEGLFSYILSVIENLEKMYTSSITLMWSVDYKVQAHTHAHTLFFLRSCFSHTLIVVTLLYVETQYPN